MANVSRPMGFSPVAHAGGSHYTAAARKYHIPASDGTAVTIGDIVKLTGAADANGVPTVARVSTSATDIPVGVVVGFVPDKTYENQIHRTASTLRYVLVNDDPNVMMECQASGTYVVATDSGLNASYTVTAVTTTTGVSNMQIDMTTKATTSTLPLLLIGVKETPDNDPTDTSNLKILCRFNVHAYKGVGIAGV